MVHDYTLRVLSTKDAFGVFLCFRGRSVKDSFCQASTHACTGVITQLQENKSIVIIIISWKNVLVTCFTATTMQCKRMPRSKAIMSNSQGNLRLCRCDWHAKTKHSFTSWQLSLELMHRMKYENSEKVRWFYFYECKTKDNRFSRNLNWDFTRENFKCIFICGLWILFTYSVSSFTRYFMYVIFVRFAKRSNKV